MVSLVNSHEELPNVLSGVTETDLARVALTMAKSAVLVADVRVNDCPLVWVSDQFEELTGYQRADALGKNCRYLQGSDREQPEIAELRRAVETRTSVEVTLRNYRRNGEMFWNQLSMAPIRAKDRPVTHMVALMRDVTAAKANHDRIIAAARTDNLTGLLNRNGFLGDVDFVAQSSQKPILIIKLDLASVNEINGSYGYEVGDFVIKATAERLNELDCFSAARIGNNEFALAFQVSHDNELARYLEQIDRAMRRPFILADRYINVTYALGYAVSDVGRSDARTLAQQAGYALHRSKADPFRRPYQHDDGARRQFEAKRKLTEELAKAVADRNFVLLYQPKVDLKSGRIYGAEALSRWQHPVFGMQSPEAFIATAEDAGLIGEIDRQAMAAAMAFSVVANHRSTGAFHICFNVSGKTICRDTFVDEVAECLKASGADPSNLTLEITENVLIDDTPSMLEVLNAIRSKGISLAIDDFGTGYSNLKSISSLPISEVKLDKAFTAGLEHDPAMRIISEAVVKLGLELQLTVIAEGVETEEQRQLLLAMGCERGQGFLFGRPVEGHVLLDCL